MRWASHLQNGIIAAWCGERRRCRGLDARQLRGHLGGTLGTAAAPGEQAVEEQPRTDPTSLPLGIAAPPAPGSSTPSPCLATPPGTYPGSRMRGASPHRTEPTSCPRGRPLLGSCTWEFPPPGPDQGLASPSGRWGGGPRVSLGEVVSSGAGGFLLQLSGREWTPHTSAWPGPPPPLLLLPAPLRSSAPLSSSPP